ncbi:hypothetical protein [Streptomyces sp. URMC 123]|uniref:hypothetical protein n=1 Tax=Streptomyces sp. URMC 123 TaxID=3423403 RepID=UPI003F1BEF14
MVGAWEFALPIDRDRLDLGQAVIAMVCEEAGNATLPLTDTLLALPDGPGGRAWPS